MKIDPQVPVQKPWRTKLGWKSILFVILALVIPFIWNALAKVPDVFEGIDTINHRIIQPANKQKSENDDSTPELRAITLNDKPETEILSEVLPLEVAEKSEKQKISLKEASHQTELEAQVSKPISSSDEKPLSESGINESIQRPTPTSLPPAMLAAPPPVSEDEFLKIVLESIGEGVKVEKFYSAPPFSTRSARFTSKGERSVFSNTDVGSIAVTVREISATDGLSLYLDIPGDARFSGEKQMNLGSYVSLGESSENWLHFHSFEDEVAVLAVELADPEIEQIPASRPFEKTFVLSVGQTQMFSIVNGLNIAIGLKEIQGGFGILKKPEAALVTLGVPIGEGIYAEFVVDKEVSTQLPSVTQLWIRLDQLERREASFTLICKKLEENDTERD